MDQIWKIAIEIVAAIGGVGVVFSAVIVFCSNFIADKLQKKYDLKLNEELERYKAGIENKKYISKTKFDAEFQLYRNLSKSFFDMVKAISTLIPRGLVMVPANEDDRKKMDEKNYQEAVKTVVIAQDELHSNAAFIPEKFYINYEEIRKLCSLQLSEFEQRWNVGYIAPQKEKERLPMEAYKRTEEISEKFDILNNEIRAYLDNLDVLE